MDQYILLNNGQKIEGGRINKVAWSAGIMVIIPGTDLVGNTILFGNPENTSHMESVHPDFKDIFDGYTKISTVNFNADGTEVNIWMDEGGNAHYERESLIPPDYEPEYIVERILGNKTT